MTDEYVIINKTALETRFKALEKLSQHNQKFVEHDTEVEIISELKDVLSESTPLIPVLEEAYFEGVGYGAGANGFVTLTDYISKLKLPI